MTGMLTRLPDGLVRIRTGSRTRCGKPTTNSTNQTAGGTLCPACTAKGSTHATPAPTD